MAAGLSIICSNHGPIPEVLGNAGIYFDPATPKSIENAIRLFIVDESLRGDLAQLAWEKAQKYSWGHCASETFDFIAKIARQQVKVQ